MKMNSVIGVMLLAFIALPIHAQVYKWVDEDGKVHFTDQPPPGQETETVEIKTSKSDTTSQQLAEQRREQLKSLEAERKDREKSRAEAANERREKKEKCAAARERAASLAWKKKIHEVDDQGNKTYLSDAEEDRVKQEANDAVARLCN